MMVEIDEIGRQSLSLAEERLAGFPSTVDKALKNAMRRTAQHICSNSSKRIRERYAISISNIRAEENVGISYRYAPGLGAEASVNFSGRKIPLYRYDGAAPKTPTYSDDFVNVVINGNWRRVHPSTPSSGHQLKGTAPVKFDNAFTLQFKSGHIGIFERTGGVTSDGNDEVKEVMGSSVPQMLGNETVTKKLSEDAAAKFDEQMSHEVDAILNGWR